MSSGNAAQTLNLGWLLCVIICSFMHSSFFMQSKNTIPCEIVISPLHSSEAPLSYLEVSLRNVFTTPVLLFHSRDTCGIWLLVSGAMYIFVIFSIESRRTGRLSPLKPKSVLIFYEIFPHFGGHVQWFQMPQRSKHPAAQSTCVKSSGKSSSGLRHLRWRFRDGRSVNFLGTFKCGNTKVLIGPQL